MLVASSIASTTSFPSASWPGHRPPCKPLAWRGLQKPCWVPGPYEQSQAQGARLGSRVPAERDQQGLSCVTFQPGVRVSQLGKERN